MSTRPRSIVAAFSFALTLFSLALLPALGSGQGTLEDYRRAATILGLEVGECMMVSSNSFDVMGARSCGMRGAFVNRDRLPYEDTPYQPDVTVSDFAGLAEALGIPGLRRVDECALRQDRWFCRDACLATLPDLSASRL